MNEKWRGKKGEQSKYSKQWRVGEQVRCGTQAGFSKDVQCVTVDFIDKIIKIACLVKNKHQTASF